MPRIWRSIKSRLIGFPWILSWGESLLLSIWFPVPGPFLRLGNLRLSRRELDRAERLFGRVTRSFPAVPEGHLGLAMAAHCRNSPEAAEPHWAGWHTASDEPVSGSPHRVRVKTLIESGRPDIALLLGLQLLNTNRVRECREVLDLVREMAPEAEGRVRAYADLASYEEVPGRELMFVDRLLERGVADEALLLRKASLLRSLGRFEEAAAIIEQRGEEITNRTEAEVSLAENASAEREYALAVERWQALHESAPGNPQIVIGYIQSLLEQVDFGMAQSVYDDASSRIQSLHFRSVQSDIYRAEAKWSPALTVMDEICEEAPGNIAMKRKRGNLLLSMYRKNQDRELLDECLLIAREVLARRPENFGNRIFLVQVLILREDFGEAISQVELLPEIDSLRVLRLRAWAAWHSQGVDASREVWNRIRNIHYVPQVAPLDKKALLRRDENRIRRSGGRITLFSVVRNEIWRLPWFLDYYRKLGVDRFFFVDNDSSDGTLSYLLDQRDVHVFWTPDSYAKAYSGMRWVNHLVDRFGRDDWCLYVDVDEALVYPDIEGRDLRSLTEYMERHGHEAMVALMIDMFSEQAGPVAEQPAETDFVKDYRLFDSSFSFLPSIYCPWTFVTGGARRNFGYHENQTKTPIIRGGRGIKFLMSSHCITPAALSDVSGALLHYKLAGDFQSAFSQDATDNARMPYCKQRHEAYARHLEAHGGEFAFQRDSIEEYSSSNQLCDLGLMAASEGYLNSRRDIRTADSGRLTSVIAPDRRTEAGHSGVRQGHGRSVGPRRRCNKQMRAAGLRKKHAQGFSSSAYNLTIGEDPGFIWFRNAKVGTRTIFSVLDNARVQYAVRTSFRCFYPEDRYRDHYKFAFVRNPWDRLVSGWIDKIRRANVLKLDEPLYGKLRDFDYFVDYIGESDLYRMNAHFRIQSEMIDLENIDFLGRMESFETDLRHVLGVLDVPCSEILWLNKNRAKRKDEGKRSAYGRFYNERTCRIVSDLYRRDIEAFGYQFAEADSVGTGA